MKKSPLLSLSVSAGALLMTCGAANAQSGEAAPTAGAAGIGDVFVTARKRARSESLQVTPVSATALTAAQIEEAHVVNLIDIGRLAPGVQFQASNQKGLQNFAIRGMGVSGTSPQDDPTVGIIQDGVYLGVNSGSITDMLDVESVEILRGPQGTLFGRNVTGGAVVVNNARPSFDKSANAMIGYGNYANTEASLVLNAPLLSDKIAGRLALKYRSSDGVYHNQHTGASQGEEQSGIVRGSVLLRPAEGVSVTLRGEWYGSDGDPVASKGLSPSIIPNAPVTLPQAEGYRTPRDFWTIAAGERGYSVIDTNFVSGELDWDVAGGVLTWISGYRSVRTNSFLDYDGFPTAAFIATLNYKQEQTSTELRFARDVSTFLSYTVGLYHYDSNLSAGVSNRLDRGTILRATESEQDASSFAAFTEADLKLSDKLTATLGVRYTEEEKTARTAPFGACTLDFNACTYGPYKDFSDTNVSPKAGLAYKVSDEHLLFASVTRGYRSGGYTLRGAPLIEPYQSETVTAYEIASKNDFFDDRLRVNVALYRNEFENLQRTVIFVSPTVGIIQSTFNAAQATIQGAELEVVANVSERLSVNASYAYTDAGYQKFIGFANPGALEFLRVPDQTAGGAITYTQPAGDLGTLRARVGVSYTGHYFFDDANTRGTEQSAFTLVDASLALTSLNKDWTVTLWGKNVTDTEYYFQGANLGTRGQNMFLGQPPTWGVRLEREF